MEKKYTTDSFIEAAKLIHGNKYDYSLLNYKNCKEKINIVCNQCSSNFFQIPRNHLSGSGCLKCTRKLSRLSTQEFINRASIIHGNKYDYSQSVYVTQKIKIEIFCKNCLKTFNQNPSDHLKGRGCRNCGILPRTIKSTKSLQNFISESNQIHKNLYDYSKSIYINNKIKIEIICKIHGSFWQQPVNHVIYAHGCKLCNTYKSSSKIENEWLDSLSVPIEDRQKTLLINNKHYYVDAFVEKTNTIYEFFGDFWHGNINNKRFLKNNIHPIRKETYEKIYNKTLERVMVFETYGFNVKYI